MPDNLPKWNEVKTPTEIINTGKPVDYIPTAKPAIIFVACPVYDALAIFLTGAYL